MFLNQPFPLCAIARVNLLPQTASLTADPSVFGSGPIKDARFLKLLQAFLKAGYMEDWKYYGTYSGCPQGGIISPTLHAHNFLHQLVREGWQTQRSHFAV